MTPSLRFPLQAGGTEWACGAVPLAKRRGTCRRRANKTLPARLVKLNDMEERL